MTSKLAFKAQEGSTFVIKADFVEKTSDGVPGLPITPNTGLKWSLRDAQGNIINTREGVSLTPAESVNIVLFGDDLMLGGEYPGRRHVTIEGTYDSLLGENLPIKIEVSFQIENLIGVS